MPADSTANSIAHLIQVNSICCCHNAEGNASKNIKKDSPPSWGIFGYFPEYFLPAEEMPTPNIFLDTRFSF